MKVKLKELIGLSLLAPVLAFMPVVVFAHDDDAAHSHESELAQTTSVNETETTNSEDVKKRVNERKAALRTRLSAAKQTRVKNRCQASQGKLSSIQGRVKGLESSRTKVHQNLVNRLNKASERLAANNVDVTTVNQQITELTTLIETFNTNLEVYKTATGDLAVMECAVDPEGFQASLETARTSRTDAGDSSQAIRAYLKETIKPTLVDLRKQLETTADDTNNENPESNNDQTQGEEN